MNIQTKAFISILLIFSACATKSQGDPKKQQVTRFISAVNKYDTLQLFELVDTSEYFDIQGKEGFLNQIDYLKMKFKECGSEFNDSTIKISHRSIPYTDYLFCFCRDKQGKTSDDSFDVLFTFADFDKNNRIHIIDIKKYNRNFPAVKKISSSQ